MRLRPGLVSVTFRPLTPREIVGLAASCGLEGIEWGGDVHVPHAAVAPEVRRTTEDAGLAVAAYGSYWRAAGDFGPTLETALALGAPTVRVWAGARGSASEDDRPAVIDALRGACELADQAGLTVSLEYHGGTLTDTLDSTLRSVREVDHPSLRLLWQPVPERPPEERLAEIQSLSPWLTNLHVFQWTRSQGEILRHPLTKGEDEWPEILRRVDGGRFALLEFVPNDDPSRLPAEAATLRRWLR